MTEYFAYIYHGDDETPTNVAQFLSMTEESDCVATAEEYYPGESNGTVCTQPVLYDDYFCVRNCTTNRSQQLRTAFKDATFLVLETAKRTDDCADVNSSEVEVQAFLADGACYGPSTIKASYDDQGFAKLTIVHGSTCYDEDPFTVLLPPEFVAEPYCVIYDSRSYDLVSSADLPSSATAAATVTTTSDTEAGMVYSVYADHSCSGQTTSMHFRAHASCVATFGESGMGCTRTFIGEHRRFFKVSCMDDWANRTARAALMKSSFGDDVYLAFDYYSSSETCGDEAFEYTYAYLANDSQHFGFDHDTARVNVATDGSVTMTRAKCTQYSDRCERNAQQFAPSSDEISLQSCVPRTETVLRSIRLPASRRQAQQRPEAERPSVSSLGALQRFFFLWSSRYCGNIVATTGPATYHAPMMQHLSS